MAAPRRVIGSIGLVLVLLLVFAGGWLAGMMRMGAAVDPVDLPAVERLFVEQMNGAALVGRFTIAGRDEAAPIADRYDLYSVDKVGDDLWRFNARIGETGLTVPVVVRMRFVDDTPVILMTDASIPGMGEGFAARLLFHGDHYAGTWGHGARGGLMYGRIERAAAKK